MTLVMGVLNVTPDSFSDGGSHDTFAAAVEHGRFLASQGAGIVDVGGESTRPGAERVPEDEEIARVVPVIEALARDGIVCSVDTMRASTALASAAVGAKIVNDVSGGLADPDMLRAVAKADAEYIAMHWRAHSTTMQEHTRYGDVVEDVVAELVTRRDAAIAAGIPGERIILDPGIGFSKTSEQNWQLLRRLDRFQSLGHRVLVGVSRKRFLGEILGGREPQGRDVATAAVTTWCALKGIWAVRTHEVRSQLDVIAVGEEISRDS